MVMFCVDVLRSLGEDQSSRSMRSHLQGEVPHLQGGADSRHRELPSRTVVGLPPKQEMIRNQHPTKRTQEGTSFPTAMTCELFPVQVVVIRKTLQRNIQQRPFKGFPLACIARHKQIPNIHFVVLANLRPGQRPCGVAHFECDIRLDLREDALPRFVATFVADPSKDSESHAELIRVGLRPVSAIPEKLGELPGALQEFVSDCNMPFDQRLLPEAVGDKRHALRKLGRDNPGAKLGNGLTADELTKKTTF
ncbi:hypothetical protein A6X21_05055 [Planctopirus hydrillae]|uniref:Uncharacterized protein n=1 Tax=Planctopirus hydrillae TaxID=1841610 RepID=A0A1C3EIT0_9PLAN|nr:hypothetical protein A6X21_05055 [Planctopirus hydrillae]